MKTLGGDSCSHIWVVIAIWNNGCFIPHGHRETETDQSEDSRVSFGDIELYDDGPVIACLCGEMVVTTWLDCRERGVPLKKKQLPIVALTDVCGES